MGSPIDIRTSVTAQGLLRKIALATFRPFTTSDWDAFLGCEDKEPLIADDVQYNGVGHTIVIDGSEVNVIRHGDMYGGQLFGLVDRDTSPAPVADEAPHMDADAAGYVIIVSPEGADRTQYLTGRVSSSVNSASASGYVKLTTLLEEAISDDPENVDALLRSYRSQAAELGLTIPDHVRIKKVVLAERDYIWE